MAAKNVLILGSSHVKRIAFEINKDNLELPRVNFNIMTHGVAGLYVNTHIEGKNIGSHLRFVTLVQPDIVVIVCGSNDLSRKVCDVDSLVTDLIAVANYCLHAGAQKVILTQIWPRNTSYFETFWARAVLFTNVMAQRLENEPHILFWRHRGLWHSPAHVLCSDGVHLSTHGNKLFLRSIRGAIIQASRQMHGQ